jgi:hypothetical protein
MSQGSAVYDDVVHIYAGILLAYYYYNNNNIMYINTKTRVALNILYILYLCLNALYYRSECVVHAFCLNKTKASIDNILYTIYYVMYKCDRNYR